MSNSLLSINMITREAIMLWRNSNEFIRNINMQYDDSFARSGGKIGQSLRIRLPNDYTVRTGPAASPQDTTETSTTLVVSTQKGVDIEFNSVERTMTLDDFSARVLAPMVNNLAGAVAADVMGGAEGGISNFTANLDASGNVLSPRLVDFLTAGAILDLRSAPRKGRKIILDPITMARSVSTLTGLLNPSDTISKQYETGMIEKSVNFEFFMDQTVIKHNTGAFVTAPTVAGANQTGNSLTVSALSGPLNIGDIITIANVNAVNRITKQSTMQAAQFVITAAAATGATSLSIYPAIVPPIGGNPVQYQTTDSSPVNGAQISVVTPTGSAYRKNIAYAPEAVTLATADLELPKGVHEAAREQFDGISMRMVSAYNITNDEFITRLDVLYGYLWVRPEWAVAVGDVI